MEETSAAMVIDALIPAKAAVAGKARLAEVLLPAERAALVYAMLRDVSRALLACGRVRSVNVTSPDAEMLSFAASLGCRPLAEPPGTVGLNGALRAALGELARRGATGVLIVQGDVPLIGPEDAAALLRPPMRAPLVRAAPTADGGTSALVLVGPEVIPLAFGPGSFARHAAAARAAGAAFEACPLPALAWDIDRPEDIPRLLGAGRATESGAALERMGAGRRFAALGMRDGAAT